MQPCRENRKSKYQHKGVLVRVLFSLFSLSVGSGKSPLRFWQYDITDAKVEDSRLRVLNELLVKIKHPGQHPLQLLRSGLLHALLIGW